ncbi:MAG: TetR/AcrR family transcriptional regulator [Desulfomonilaceae bacterium]
MKSTTKGQKTRTHIIDSATRLINKKTYSATSIEDIIHATGVKKGNLYFHFSSKEELGLAVVREAGKDFSTFISEHLCGERPVDKLANFLDAVMDKHRDSGFVGG